MAHDCAWIMFWFLSYLLMAQMEYHCLSKRFYSRNQTTDFATRFAPYFVSFDQKQNSFSYEWLYKLFITSIWCYFDCFLCCGFSLVTHWIKTFFVFFQPFRLTFWLWSYHYFDWIPRFFQKFGCESSNWPNSLLILTFSTDTHD